MTIAFGGGNKDVIMTIVGGDNHEGSACSVCSVLCITHMYILQL